MTKSYIWKLLKNGELREVQSQGPHWDEFILNEGPFTSVEEAEIALETYYEKYKKEFGYDDCNGEYCTFEEFVLLTVYSRN